MREMMNKICSKCKEEKPFDSFNKGNDKYGLHFWCKDCCREYRENNKEKIAIQKKEYYENNKEQIIEYKKEYRKNNRDRLIKNDKAYYQNNKERAAEYGRRYRENNKERAAEYGRRYRENNKEQIVENKKEYYENNKKQIAEKRKKRLRTDIDYKIASTLRSRMSQAIKNNYKQGSAVRDLGCSIEFLKQYLEKQFRSSMNWDNHGEVWQIDHIIPLCAFDLTNKFQFRAACYYKNLQPLYVEKNLSKNGNYEQKDYEKYLEYFKTEILKFEVNENE